MHNYFLFSACCCVIHSIIQHIYDATNLLRRNVLNIVVEWITCLLHIREFPGSNFGPQASYLTEVFHYFSQYLQANAVIMP